MEGIDLTEALVTNLSTSDRGELVLILDFGAQYTQLIARRVRECNVYCEILPFDTPTVEVKKRHP